MEDFKISDCRILGFIEECPDSEHATVTVVGYLPLDSNEYILFDKITSKRSFPEHGKVFAPYFQWDKSNVSKNSFIEFSCILSPEKREGFDAYIVNYDYSLPIKSVSAHNIITVNFRTSLESGFVTQDELNSCIDKTIFNKTTSSFFLKYNDSLFGLFKYDSLKENIIPIKGKEANEYKIDEETYLRKCIQLENGNDYYIEKFKTLTLNSTGQIDCMTDAQLGAWFKDFLKDILSAEKMLTVSKSINDFVTRNKETNDILQEIRLDRIKGKLDALNFNHKELETLFSLDSKLLDTLKEQINQQKSEFEETWKRDLEDEKAILKDAVSHLNKEKETIKNEISHYKKNLQLKEADAKKSFEQNLAVLNAKIKEKEDSLKRITADYDSILATLKVALPLLQEQKQEDTILITPIEFPKGNKTFTELDEEEGFDFNTSFKKNISCEKLDSKIKAITNTQLFTSKAVFIPNLSWAYIYAKGIRNARLFILHIEHDWLHYKDFCNHGLLEVFKSCYEYTDTNHILVFDSINLTQPECGLKSILDVINRYTCFIPGLNKELPTNLKIMATVEPSQNMPQIGLPLLPSSFENWGCFGNPECKLSLPEDFLLVSPSEGYCTPEEINKMICYQNHKETENEYFKY